MSATAMRNPLRAAPLSASPLRAARPRPAPLKVHASLGAVFEGACGLDPAAAAARLALAPPSVQSFISRWGTREGIDKAYTAECVVSWGAAVLDSMEEVPGHHLESAQEAAFRERVESMPEVVAVAVEDPAARLARAPPSVQAFIARWGRREGIDGQ